MRNLSLWNISDGQQPRSAGGKRGGYFGNFSPWVLTRLHTRYDRTTLSEDLLFREAKPVVGGRSTSIEDASTSDSTRS